MTELAIIGAGPTGLFAAYYAGLRNMTVKLIDSLEIPGGQLATLYPEKDIFDVAGFPKILAKDLVAGLLEQAMFYKPTICLGEHVQQLNFDEQADHFHLVTSRDTHPVRAVIISGGIGAFEPKTLPLPEARQYEGHGLHYFVKSVSSFAGKRVLIVGGGDSAIDWGNAIAPIAGQLTLIHRRDQFRAHEQSVDELRKKPVDIKTFRELKSIGGDGRIQRATIVDNRSHVEETLEVDAVLVNVGFVSSLGPIKEWGLQLEGGQIKVDGMMHTNRPRVFAAGDICAYAGKLKLIATGFGEACIAVNFAKHALDPAATIFPGHSSAMER
jgi:thioredoxin reductase (NADPH)